MEAMAKSLRADSKTVATIMASPEESAPAQQPAPAVETLDATSYHVARTLRESAEAKMAQLRLRQMAGELVDAQRVRLSATSLAATTRNAFERIPDKLADRLAAESDPTTCHAMLVAEIDQVLADLAAGARSMKLEA
jgi:phage terminase Nu1 subunit (DNA packaging protein)